MTSRSLLCGLGRAEDEAAYPVEDLSYGDEPGALVRGHVKEGNVELPDLSRVVDTYLPVERMELGGYLVQLKRDVLPHIRKLQSDGHLRWYAFLLHGASLLEGREPDDGRLFVHLRLEPAAGLEPDAFVKLLPDEFRKPKLVQLADIAGLRVELLRDHDWAHGWRIHGEASEWVLRLLEGHGREPSIQQMIEFLHFITNPLMLGHRCLCIPAGYLSF